MNKGFLLIEFFVVFTIIFLVNGLSYSADVTVSTALTTSEDEITMGSNDTVTIASSGSIIVDEHLNAGLIKLPVNTSNLTIINNGTIQVGEYDGVNDSGGENNAIGASGAATNITITHNGVIAASGRHAINLQAGEGNITIINTTLHIILVNCLMFHYSLGISVRASVSASVSVSVSIE